MEEVGADYGAVEWTIENFSCWNAEIHHVVITSLNFLGESHIEIRPRGGYNPRVSMSVRMLGDPRTEVSGDLSLIASDGYVFCSEEVHIDSHRTVFDLPSAPVFEDIVSRRKMLEGLHKDQITVRFQMRAAVSDSVLYMRTVICVQEFSVRVSSEEMNNISLYRLKQQLIRTIKYPSGSSATAGIDIYAGVGGMNDKCIVFKMQQTEKSQEIAFIRSRISVIDKDRAVVRRAAREGFCGKGYEFCKVSDFLLRTEVEEKRTGILWHLRITPENKSELLCTYTTDQGQIFPSGSSSRPTYNASVEKPSEIITADTSNQPENSMEVLTKDLMCLYQDQDFSDITLKCDNVTFPVHKNILSARSPVFKTMLSTDMKETASGTVDIGDLDPSTLGLFLTYLYTGSVEEELQGERALKLYYAADKYQVPSLKRDCSKFLCATVSIGNVCDFLALADRHEDENLASASRNFILNHYNEVLGSEEWKSFMASEPLLAVQTLTHFGEKGFLGKRKRNPE